MKGDRVYDPPQEGTYLLYFYLYQELSKTKLIFITVHQYIGSVHNKNSRNLRSLKTRTPDDFKTDYPGRPYTSLTKTRDTRCRPSGTGVRGFCQPPKVTPVSGLCTRGMWKVPVTASRSWSGHGATETDRRERPY